MREKSGICDTGVTFCDKTPLARSDRGPGFGSLRALILSISEVRLAHHGYSWRSRLGSQNPMKYGECALAERLRIMGVEARCAPALQAVRCQR